jgi:hypothetical protein
MTMRALSFQRHGTMDEATRETIRQDLASSRDELEAARILHRERKCGETPDLARYACTGLIHPREVVRAVMPVEGLRAFSQDKLAIPGVTRHGNACAVTPQKLLRFSLG